jgi:quercetin dioxygenase-like cupin family protein
VIAVVFATVTAIVAVASNSSRTAEAVAVAPGAYRVVIDNERVRVLEARIRPGQRVGTHAHPDHVVVVTAPGKLELTTSDGARVIDAKVGDAFYFEADTHTAENVGATEFVCVVTELKGKSKSKGEASPRPGTIEVQQGNVDG